MNLNTLGFFLNDHIFHVLEVHLVPLDWSVFAHLVPLNKNLCWHVEVIGCEDVKLS